MQSIETIERYNYKLSWPYFFKPKCGPLSSIQKLAIQGFLLSVTSLAIGLILAQNGTAAAAFYHQKTSLSILLALAVLQCVKLSFDADVYKKDKNHREFIESQVERIFPTFSETLAPLHSIFPSPLKRIICEYFGKTDLKSMHYLNAAGLVADYQEYCLQKFGTNSWKDIQTVFTDLSLIRQEMAKKECRIEDPFEWILSVDFFDATFNFEVFNDVCWEFRKGNYPDQINKHLPILTRFFLDNPKKKNSYQRCAGFWPCLALTQNGNMDLLDLVFARNFEVQNFFDDSFLATEQVAFGIYQKYLNEIKVRPLHVDMASFQGWHQILKQFVLNTDLKSGDLLGMALAGALVQKKILKGHKVQESMMIGNLSSFCLVNGIRSADYHETIRFLKEEINPPSDLVNHYIRVINDHRPELDEYLELFS